MIHPFSFWKTSAAAHPGQALFNTWEAGVDAAGGTYTGSSKTIALDLADQIASASYYSKIKYLLPLLGADIVAARMPLVDVPVAGIATNYNFVGGDFSESTGLQGNGTTKRLDTLIQQSQLGTLDNGGMGYWEKNIGSAGIQCGAREPIGVLWMFSFAASTTFYSGSATSQFNDGTTPGNDHYYGQRLTNSSRTLYKNGSSVASSSAADSATTGTNKFNVCAIDGTFLGGGRCGVFYLTNGQLSGAEATAFHTLLTTYLMTPTGR